MQRVSDEQVAVDCGEGCWVDSHERDLALDLRDARARLAALEPVVRSAVDWRSRFLVAPECHLALAQAVDALPEEMRKELAGPPIDWDAPIDGGTPEREIG